MLCIRHCSRQYWYCNEKSWPCPYSHVAYILIEGTTNQYILVRPGLGTQIICIIFVLVIFYYLSRFFLSTELENLMCSSVLPGQISLFIHVVHERQCLVDIWRKGLRGNWNILNHYLNSNSTDATLERKEWPPKLVNIPKSDC